MAFAKKVVIFLADTSPILEPLIPLFWISGDVSSSFQNGFCLIHLFVNKEYYTHLGLCHTCTVNLMFGEGLRDTPCRNIRNW